MAKKTSFALLILLLIFAQGNSQTIESLRKEITDIMKSKNALVGVAIDGPTAKDTLSIHGKRHFPMQSVF
ncbi:MAG: class A beta-lactamase, partial [Bacteroidota bacterium]